MPNTTLTNDQLATRFLAQATFGPSPDALAELRALNYDYGAWITREAAKPASSAVNILVVARDAGQITTINTDLNRRARNQVMISGSDQLRQRVAYALSQIMVVSDVDSAVANGLDMVGLCAKAGERKCRPLACLGMVDLRSLHGPAGGSASASDRRRGCLA